MPRKPNPKPREARQHLVEALAALEDPQSHYRREVGNSRYADDPVVQQAYAVGAAKALIKFALHKLGEPINPYETPAARLDTKAG